jgi:succinate-semialdehyde dehydrogenase/glutarate-semialdehyde dehydrogenase
MTTVDARALADILDRVQVNHLIDAIVASPRAEQVTVEAPFTGERLVDLPLSTPDDVAAAYQAARSAQHAWVARPLHERARIIGRVHDLVLDRQSELADLVQAETGKARKDAFEEVMDVALAARYAAARGPKLLRPRRRLGAIPGLTSALEVRHSKGVVGLISPWNYPLTLGISDSLPAFVAGNAVVHKPDTHVALTALRARSIAVEAGLPEGLWQIVVGDGPTIGGAVVQHADYVSFTGSTAVGRLIGKQTGERLVGASLELGGKNAMLVLDDADLDRTAEGAVRASFSNSGQLCIAMERIYVAEKIKDEFVAKFREQIEKLRLGASLDYTTDMGTLISKAQLDKVTQHVEDAAAKGAHVVVGGKPRPDLGPYFFEPTVLEGVEPGMLACEDETFGPVVSIYSVADDEEAIARANATAYGLNGSVWTRDTRRGVAVAKRLRAGAINVNEGYVAAWGSHDLPSGGMGASGLGRRHGEEGILRYTEPQAIAVQKLMGIKPVGRMTYDGFAKVMTGSLRTLKRLRRP